MQEPRPPLVGVFDSGVGGLTIVDALHRLMPALPLRYVADTAFFPYGDRSDEEVAARAHDLTAALVRAGCDLIVVACNTASSAALEQLRARFEVPIVGMEPPVKPAVERSRSGRIAVLVTPATARGARLERLNRAHGAHAEVETIPMAGLAALVESGEVHGARIDAALHLALDRPLREGVDEIALGCTHYGFVRRPIEDMLPDGVEVLDAAEPVARRVRDQLTKAGHAIPEAPPAEVHCSATGGIESFQATIEALRAGGATLPPLVIEPYALDVREQTGVP